MRPISWLPNTQMIPSWHRGNDGFPVFHVLLVSWGAKTFAMFVTKEFWDTTNFQRSVTKLGHYSETQVCIPIKCFKFCMWTAKKLQSITELNLAAVRKFFKNCSFLNQQNQVCWKLFLKIFFFKKIIDFGKRISNVVFFGQTTGRDFSLILADV